MNWGRFRVRMEMAEVNQIQAFIDGTFRQEQLFKDSHLIWESRGSSSLDGSRIPEWN